MVGSTQKFLGRDNFLYPHQFYNSTFLIPDISHIGLAIALKIETSQIEIISKKYKSNKNKIIYVQLNSIR